MPLLGPGPKQAAWRRSLGAACIGLAGCAKPSAAELALTEQRVVYGIDDRVELVEASDPAVRQLGESVVFAIVAEQQLRFVGDTVEVQSPTVDERFGLCPGYRFAGQPSVAGCSGVLIDDDLVLTAAHCLPLSGDCGKLRLALGFRLGDAGPVVPLTPNDVYSCRQVLVSSFATGPDRFSDHGIIQLDRAVPAARPVEVTEHPTLEQGQSLLALGHPAGLPMKVDTGVRVVSIEGSETLRVTADASEGSSGSPLLDTGLGLVGLLTGGAADFMTVGGCNVANVVLEACPGCEHEGEQAVFAQTAITDLCTQG